MAMTHADVAAQRLALNQRKQAAYEALYNAIVGGDQTAKKAAKSSLGDCADEDDALNYIDAMITLITGS